MNSRHMFDYALRRGNQSEDKIFCQNSHVEAIEKIMLATEDAKTLEEMELSLTKHIHYAYVNRAVTSAATTSVHYYRYFFSSQG